MTDNQSNIDRYLFFFLAILNFLPFYIGVLAFIFVFFYLAYIGKIRFTFLSQNNISNWFSFFSFYSLLLSIINQNIYGVAVSCLYFIYILYYVYLEKCAQARLFNDFINLCLLASLVIFAYTVLEHLEIISEWDYSFITSKLSKNHSDRVEATFFNPNYFAMALEFFIIMGLYKLMTSRTTWKRWIYLFLTLANILASFFTGNRTGPVVILTSIIVFFYVLSHRRTAHFLSISISLILVIFIITGHYPRIESIEWALQDRIEIWDTAWQGIKEHYIFGQGPYTYMLIYNQFDGKFTYHAHSIYLDSLLNYGLVGCGILLVPIFKYGKWIIKLSQYPTLKSQAALIWSFITIFLVHGLTDMAIYWFQTAFIFLTIMILVPKLVKEEEKRLIAEKIH